MTVLFFAVLFSLSVFWTVLNGLAAREAGGTIFLTGFVTLFIGLIMSYNWLGEKPDYSRTAYVVKVQGWGPIVYPRTNPGPKLSGRTEEAVGSARIILDLIDLSVIVTGVSLMIASGALNFLS